MGAGGGGQVPATSAFLNPEPPSPRHLSCYKKNDGVDEKDVAAGASGRVRPVSAFSGRCRFGGFSGRGGFFEGGDVRLLQAGSGGRLPVDTGSISK